MLDWMRNPLSPHERAGEIMGDFFISPDMLADRLGLALSRRQAEQLRPIPFPERELRLVRKTHVLFPALGWTTSRVLALADAVGVRVTDETGKLAQVEEKLETRWYLVRRNAVPSKEGKTAPEEVARLSSRQVVPSVTVVLCAGVLTAGLRRQNLFCRTGIRTCTPCGDGRDLTVTGTWSKQHGLQVDALYPRERNSRYGIGIEELPYPDREQWL